MADVIVDPEVVNPQELYGKGVRAYILEDYDGAVAALSKALELLVAEHKDDMHSSLGEIYLYYGKALLAVSREQNDALGEGVPKDNEESADDDDDEEAEGGEEKEPGKDESSDKIDDVSATEADSSKSEIENGDEQVDPPEPSTSNGDTKQEEGEGDTTQPDEDLGDLQLAWEVLEFAKQIFERDGKKKQLAESLIGLGQISLENSNMEAAIEDMKQGLAIQLEVLPKDSRDVAETYYQLGMTYGVDNEFDLARESYKKSIEYLESRIKHLEELKPEEFESEIEEIKALLPELQEKISDLEVAKTESATNGKLTDEDAAKPLDAAGSSKQAHDISHLVKRKRKTGDDGDIPAKKPSL